MKRIFQAGIILMLTLLSGTGMVVNVRADESMETVFLRKKTDIIPIIINPSANARLMQPGRTAERGQPGTASKKRSLRHY